MPPIHLLIKPASGQCSMSCTYCFYHDIVKNRHQESYGFMSLSTMEQMVKKAVVAAEESLTLAFQGGEPTLIGLPFFQSLIKTVNTYKPTNLKVFYALQTNGFHLDREWAAFLAKEHFLTGISIDGTIHTHNTYRKSRDGNPTFLDIMKTVNLFNEYGVDYNILTVVNQKTAASIKKIYEYDKKMGFHYLQFIPCLDPFGIQPGSMAYSLTPEAYGTFLCQLFDLWYEELQAGQYRSIRQFDNYISILKNGRGESCDMNGFCSMQNVVEADGEVYPCDFFVLDEFKLGNLNELSFEEINQNCLNSGFLSPSKAPGETCRSCEYYPLCRGGCYRHRVMGNQTKEQKNYFCDSYGMFFRHALPRLAQAARIL